MKFSKFIYYGQTAAAKEGKKIAGVVALAVAGEAKTTHVKGFGFVTGDLQNAYQPVEQGDGWAVINGMYYAPFIEFGTKYIPAQAHLRNACQRITAQYSNVTWSANG